MGLKELRQKFLIFFEKKGHKIIPSSSLLPSDPSVLFTTAGMQQFKPYFLGEPSPYGKRVTSCQKCFRTSDIGEVGDETHLTLLEMLGNFSFGSYFKKEAIKWSLQFLTEVCGLEAENLWITFFEGDEDVPEDKESQKISLELGIPANRIHGFGRDDNFWGPVGKEGPCGPTVEIHYDLRGKPCHKGRECFPNCKCGRFVEVWNLVFNEYYQDKKGNLSLLKQKGVDTGMGLERLAMVVQGKYSVFETKPFSLLIDDLRKWTTRPYKLNHKPYRIVADHVRASVFLASSGIIPSNLGRGYILRRLVRRAVRYGRLLQLNSDFLLLLTGRVIEIYKDVYPELQIKQAEILTIIQNEQEKFKKTLDK